MNLVVETILNILNGESPQPRTPPYSSSTAKRNIIMPISLCTKSLLIGLTEQIKKAKEENNLSLLCDIAQIKDLLKNPDSQSPGRSAIHLTRNLVSDFKTIHNEFDCRKTDITLHAVFADGCLYEHNIMSQLNIGSDDQLAYDSFIKQTLKNLQEAILDYYQPALENAEGLAGGSIKFYTWDQFIKSKPVSYDALAYAGSGKLWSGIINFSNILKPGIKDNAAGHLKVLEDELLTAYNCYQKDNTSLTLSSLKHVKKHTHVDTVKGILNTIQSSASKYNKKRNKSDNSLYWSVRYIIHEMIALALHIQQKTGPEPKFILANNGNRKGKAIPLFLENIKTGLAETILNGLATKDKTTTMGNIYAQPLNALKCNSQLHHIKINNNFAPQFFKDGSWPSKSHDEHLTLLEHWVTRPGIINDVYQLLTSSLYLNHKALPIICTPEFQKKLKGLDGKESNIKALVKESQDNFIFAYLRYSIKNSPYPAILIVVFFLSIYSSIYMTPNAPAHMLTLAMIASLFSITLILSALDYRQCRAAADKIYSVLLMQTKIDAYFSIRTSSISTTTGKSEKSESSVPVDPQTQPPTGKKAKLKPLAFRRTVAFRSLAASFRDLESPPLYPAKDNIPNAAESTLVFLNKLRDNEVEKVTDESSFKVNQSPTVHLHFYREAASSHLSALNAKKRGCFRHTPPHSYSPQVL